MDKDKLSFVKNLNYYLELNNISPSKLKKDLSIPYTTYIAWMNYQVYPREETLDKIADYLKIDKKDLTNSYDISLNSLDLKKLLLSNLDILTFEDIKKIKYIITNRLLQEQYKIEKVV